MSMSYVVVFRGDATTGGFPIAITTRPEAVRSALEAGLEEIWRFAGDVRNDPALRLKAKGNIQAIEQVLGELDGESDGQAR